MVARGPAFALCAALALASGLGAALPGWLENPKRSNPLDPKSPLNKNLNPSPVPTPGFNHAHLSTLGNYGTGNKQYVFMGRVKWLPTGQILVTDFGPPNGEVLDASSYAWIKNFSVMPNYPPLLGDSPLGFYGVAWDGAALHVPESGSRVRMLDSSFDNSAGLYDAVTSCQAPPELCAAEGIAVDSGFIFIADTGNDRIQKRDLATKNEVQSVGSSGAALGQLESPTDIEIGPGGAWYVADSGNHRVQRFTAAGAADLAWGSFGTGPGQFNGPSDLSVDIGGGRVFVADPGNKRFQVFDLNGNFQYQQNYTPQTGAFETLRAIDFDPATGRLLIGQNASFTMIPRVFVLAAYP